MIYTQFGEEVEIIENYGRQLIAFDQPQLTLVKLKLVADGWCRYRFAETLKADKGAKEIFTAVKALKERRLEITARTGAIKEAM